jgi:hypothetical protein
MALANLQEKIFLNSNQYTANVATAYTGQNTGGLGLVASSATCAAGTSGKSKDDRYAFCVAATATTFTLTAMPKTGTAQAGDGNLTINEQAS